MSVPIYPEDGDPDERPVRQRAQPLVTLAEIREWMTWWRMEARLLRSSGRVRIVESGRRMDALLDAIEAEPRP